MALCYPYQVMPSTVTIKLPKQERERLGRLALRYGFSLPEFSRRILEELAAAFPEDSFENYRNPKALKSSFRRALRDWQRGHLSARL